MPIPIHKYTLLSRLTSSPMAVEKQTWLAKTAQPNQQVGKLARSLQHQGHNTMRRHGIPGIQSNQLDLQFLHMIARDYTLHCSNAVCAVQPQDNQNSSTNPQPSANQPRSAVPPPPVTTSKNPKAGMIVTMWAEGSSVSLAIATC